MGMQKSRPLIIAIVILALLGLGSYYYWANYVRGKVSTDDARFSATMVDVSPDIPGHLTAVNVREGDRVRKGEVLFTLDATDLKAKIASARASLPVAQAAVEVAKARLEKAKHGPRPEQVKAAKAAVDRVIAEFQLAKLNRDRLQKLVASHSIPQAKLDQANTAYEVAQQGVEGAKEHLRMLQLGTRSEDLKAAHAGLKLAQARVNAAKTTIHQVSIMLRHTTVVAPFDGVIVKRWKDPDEDVAPGVPVLTILNPKTLHIDANVEETDVRNVQVGDRVDIDIDAYPDLHLTGYVRAVLPATESAFSLMPSSSASGSYIKVTQRVPLRVSLVRMPKKPGRLFGPGLSVELTIHSNTPLSSNITIIGREDHKPAPATKATAANGNTAKSANTVQARPASTVAEKKTVQAHK